MSVTQATSVASKLKKIREAYIRQIPAQIQGIRGAYTTFVTAGREGGTLEELHRRIHSVRGSSASFGFGLLSIAAAAGEKLAKDALGQGDPPDRQWHQDIQHCMDQMEEEIGRIDPEHGFDVQMQGLATGIDDSDTKDRKVVYLCEDDSFQRITLATQIGCFGFEVVAFGQLEQLYNAVKNAPPDAIIMDIIFPEKPLGGAEIISTIQSERENHIPTIFISSQDDLTHRLTAVRAGSDAYFVKPVNIPDLCSILAAATSTEKPEPYRVLIIDDEPQLADYHALILQEAGMVTRTVNDPLHVMSPLLEFNPDLILMDMHMPGFNGMELAKAIRQISAFFSIPIVFLSSETDTEKQFSAMRMGGDEFLAKPIKPHHLVTSVAVRAQRMKIIRSAMIRDSMTGLYNHTAAKEQLDSAIASAGRNGTEVCIAVIDVDRFKAVNDTYGHPAGDRVLVSLARLLQQRLRKTDVVGRSGGEEFVVILPSTPLAESVALMNQLRESFAAIQFQSQNETFSCTFSCGVAAFSQYGIAARLCDAADKSLYEAKHRGRNLVVTSESTG